MQFQIDNEYDRLEAVLVHRPGLEIDRLTHDNMKDYLFEDIPYLRRMQDEHDAFVGKMREHRVNVVYLEALLKEILDDPQVRRSVVAHACQIEGMPALGEDLASLKFWNLDELVECLFAGVTAGEYEQATGRRLTSGENPDDFLLRPIPNAYFSRDPAVVVRETAISSKMHYFVRVRESTLTRAVLEHHPDFRTNAITYGGTGDPEEDRPYTIEGGDVIVLSSEAVLIGDSERTRSETIELLAGKCFQLGHIKRVYEIPIPTERSFMHLDTVFTVIDHGLVLWFPGVMANLGYIHRYEGDAEDPRAARRLSEERTLHQILSDEFGTETQIIDTGGGAAHYAKREQRADGTNTFAIGPRQVIVYERNERTIAALQDHDVTCIPIDDSELVRGLGGPRCMTMPLRRTR